MEQLNYNLLFRWFVGLEMDDAVWDVTVFTKNRERLISGQVSQALLSSVLVQARENKLLSECHFTVDGTLIQAWAASRSFEEKSDPPQPGEGSGPRGEVLLRDKVESKTDPEARLFKKATADKSVPSYQGHALMENRNRLVVAAEASQSATNAERELALDLLDQVLKAGPAGNTERQVTLGADTQYQEEKFIAALRQRGVAPARLRICEGKPGQKQSERSRACRLPPLDQPTKAQADRAGLWLGQVRSIASPSQATRTETRGLVFPLDRYRL